MTSHLPPELDTLIIRGVRQGKRTFLVAGLSMVGLGIIIGAALFFLAERPLEDRLLWSLLFAGALALIGTPFLALALGDPAKAKVVTALRSRSAASIVWLTWLGPAARDRSQSVTVSIGFDDGGLASVTAPIDDANAIYHALQSYAPHATCGYTEELAAQFQRAPASLRAPTS